MGEVPLHADIAAGYGSFRYGSQVRDLPTFFRIFEMKLHCPMRLPDLQHLGARNRTVPRRRRNATQTSHCEAMTCLASAHCASRRRASCPALVLCAPPGDARRCTRHRFVKNSFAPKRGLCSNPGPSLSQGGQGGYYTGASGYGTVQTQQQGGGCEPPLNPRFRKQIPCSTFPCPPVFRSTT